MGTKFIVAIGSSAGGLIPLLNFFDFTPHDHASYILLRHLPIRYKSKIQEILGKHTHLRILEVSNDTTIEYDTIYIPPTGMNMTIENDRLFLSPRGHHPLDQNLMIDIFLTSLAKCSGPRSIVVLLFGIGKDGSIGASLVKEAGGLVIVQNPNGCEYSAMSINAINTGFVDYVMTPEDMPKVIAGYITTFS